MSEPAKAAICNSVVGQGHTDSYGALLYLVALMGTDSTALEPESDEELANWEGHFSGLRAALVCLAGHERKIGPTSAVAVIERQLEDAMDALKRYDSGGTGR